MRSFIVQTLPDRVGLVHRAKSAIGSARRHVQFPVLEQVPVVIDQARTSHATGELGDRHGREHRMVVLDDDEGSIRERFGKPSLDAFAKPEASAKFS